MSAAMFAVHHALRGISKVWDWDPAGVFHAARYAAWVLRDRGLSGYLSPPHTTMTLSETHYTVCRGDECKRFKWGADPLNKYSHLCEEGE